MAQETGYISHTTVKTLYTSSTSYLVVDLYTNPSGALKPVFLTEEWWTFQKAASTSASTTHPSLTTIPPDDSISCDAQNSPGSNLPLELSLGAVLIGGLGILLGYWIATWGRRDKKRPAQDSQGIELVPVNTGRDGNTQPATMEAQGGEAQASTTRSNPRTNLNPHPKPLPRPTPAIADAANTLNLSSFLIDARSEADLAADLRHLNTRIKQHVETHYNMQPILPANQLLDDALHEIGIDGGAVKGPEKITRLATAPQTRRAALRYVIARAALESTVIGGPIRISLLPPIAAAAARAFRVRDGAAGALMRRDRLAIARWRQVTAYLLLPDRALRTPLVPGPEVSEGRAEELVEALNAFLEPFIGSEREAQREALRGVVVECARFGYVLFSQPCEYKLQFDTERRGEDLVVVFPGLQRVIGTGGRVYEAPLPLVVAPIVEMASAASRDSSVTVIGPVPPAK